MASILLSSVGASLGGSILPIIGSRFVASYARKFGKEIDSYLGLYSTTEATKLTNLRVSDSSYGTGISLPFGQARVGGNVIWASDLITTEHNSSILGGKGGILGSTSSGVSYTYAVHCAIAIAEGPLGGVQTIWADTTVIYQNGVWNSGLVDSATFYLGTDTQTPDPFMESMIGSGEVPAYKGMAYVVLENLQLKSFGNRLPSLTFEILPSAMNTNPVLLTGAATAVCQSTIGGYCNAVPPIVLEGSARNASRMLVGGFVTSGAKTVYHALELDTSEETPRIDTDNSSAEVALKSVFDNAWALSTDGRYIALCLQGSDDTPHFQFCIYDTEGQAFGAWCGVAMSNGEYKQIAWLDSLHFVVSDVQSGVRGVRVFMRSGLAVVDLGFFAVWGVGSASTRVPFLDMQFTAVSGGLMAYAGAGQFYTTALYAKPIYWQSGGLSVGGELTVFSGASLSKSGGPAGRFLKTGDAEWTLCFATVSSIELFSFEITATSVAVTRPWQKFTSAAQPTFACSVPVVMGSALVFVQTLPYGYDTCVSIFGLDAGAFTRRVDAMAVTAESPGAAAFNVAKIDGARLLVLPFETGDLAMNPISSVRLYDGATTLAVIVGGILDRAGYVATDYDVTDLASVSVEGYVLENPATAADALASLRVYEPFDLIETGGMLTAKRRGVSAVASLEEKDRGVAEEGEKEVVPLCALSRARELDLPKEITIDYCDPARDYETGTQRARKRVTNGAKSVAKITLPIVCSASKAKQIAENRLFSAWAERETASLTLAREWAMLEPGDVVTVGEKLVRVVSVKMEKGVVRVAGSVISAQAIASSASAEAGATTTQDVVESIATVLYLIDAPLLRGTDDEAGIYMAVSGREGWRGAGVWRSADGSSYSSAADFTNAASAGIAASVLADAATDYMDRANSVTVQMIRGTLASCSEADLLNGANAVWMGGEILQFQTATLVATGCYVLSNLLRGRKGTESATGTHVLGEDFVVLASACLQFVPALLSDRGRSYDFRALSYGQTIGAVSDVALTYGLKTLQPLAPVQIRGARANGTGSDLVVSWVRRARKNAEWVDYIDVPLDEDQELYDVEIWNGASLVRTFSALTSTSVTYSAAQQVSDGTSALTSVTVKIYQISARYGRGAAGSTSI